jgi:hypothetical protein
MPTDDFEWTGARIEAAQLLAEGRLAEAAIAERVGCDRKTLWRWRQDPAFAGRVAEIVGQLGAEALRRGLAVRTQRLAAINDRWERMRLVLEARADDPDLADVPGGTTGLLVKTVTFRGSGDNVEKTVEAEVDVALLREIREAEKQAAQETGQWVEKRQVEQTAKLYVTQGPDDL